MARRRTTNDSNRGTVGRLPALLPLIIAFALPDGPAQAQIEREWIRESSGDTLFQHVVADTAGAYVVGTITPDLPILVVRYNSAGRLLWAETHGDCAAANAERAGWTFVGADENDELTLIRRCLTDDPAARELQATHWLLNGDLSWETTVPLDYFYGQVGDSLIDRYQVVWATDGDVPASIRGVQGDVLVGGTSHYLAEHVNDHSYTGKAWVQIHRFGPGGSYSVLNVPRVNGLVAGFAGWSTSIFGEPMACVLDPPNEGEDWRDNRLYTYDPLVGWTHIASMLDSVGARCFVGPAGHAYAIYYDVVNQEPVLRSLAPNTWIVRPDNVGAPHVDHQGNAYQSRGGWSHIMTKYRAADGSIAWEKDDLPRLHPPGFEPRSAIFDRNLAIYAGNTPGQNALVKADSLGERVWWKWTRYQPEDLRLADIRHLYAIGPQCTQCKRYSAPGWIARYVQCVEDSVTWNGTDGEFANVNNWSGRQVPDDSLIATFGHGGATYDVALTDSVRTASIRSFDNVSMYLSGMVYDTGFPCRAIDVRKGTLTLIDGKVNARGAVTVHDGVDPILVLTSRALLQFDEGRDFYIGTEHGEAAVRLEESSSIMGPASTILASGESTTGWLQVNNSAFTGRWMLVGDHGEGRLYMFEDAVVSLDTLAVGVLGDGAATVNASSLFSKSILVSHEDNAAPSSVQIENGSHVGVTDWLIVGQGANTDATFTLAQSYADLSGEVVIGQAGMGAMYVNGGSRVNLPDPLVVGNFTLGLEDGAEGILELDDLDTELWARSIAVGQRGYGRMMVENGAVVNAATVWVGGRNGTGLLGVGIGSTLVAGFLGVGPDGHVASMGTLDVGATGIITRISKADATITVDTLFVEGAPVIEADSIVFHPGGVLGGSGTLTADVVNAGSIGPGLGAGSIATLTLAGGYAQTGPGVLDIELAGSGEGEYDRLVVADTARLGGTLRISLVGAFSPAVGHAFEILQAAYVEGTFDVVDIVDGFRVELVHSETSVTVVVTSLVGLDGSDELPTEFRLWPNYPNPFNPSTTIAYDLPVQADVTVKIVDLLGRNIRVFAEGRKPAGTHTFTFDATGVPSGVLFYRLEAGSFVEVRRMVLVK